jgi:GAF domain-containing protein
MSVRLFRRRKGGKPAGPWIAWGFDAQGRRWSESTQQLDEKAARSVARDLERRHADPAHAAAHEATLHDAFKRLISTRDGEARAGRRAGLLIATLPPRVQK